MAASFLWYDLETFGRDPRRTRIAQFAAVRTDEALNPVGDPISLFCQPANDLLPSPEATLITGITPQQALRDGLPEAEFFARVHEQLSQPNTCAVGYNSIRFDDEFIRFGLYRNFYDAYEREWRNGNSRWDLLDVMRLMHALRPEGMQWPLREDGMPSFKLEHLAEANGTRTGTAHEALSDVRALIGLARKFRQAQPKLWDYALRLRDKRHAGSLLDTVAQTPVLHISGMYPAARHCAALVIPLARHPRIDSRVIACDLDVDPDRLLSLSAEDIADRLYTPVADLPEGRAAGSAQGNPQQQVPHAAAAGAPARGRLGKAGDRPARLPAQRRPTALRAGPGRESASRVRQRERIASRPMRTPRCTTASSPMATSALS